MKSHRHPHPHKDPRRPRDHTSPGTNPPLFAWLPVEDADEYLLTVARDADFRDVCLQERLTDQPLYLPRNAFTPGRYYWKWSGGSVEGEVFTFEVTPEAVVLEVPAAEEWLRRLSDGHPRIYIRPEEVAALHQSRHNTRAAQSQQLKATADEILAEDHEIAEPPFLPDRQADYEAWYSVWAPIMWDSRRFVKGAEILALAHLTSGEIAYARAACRRMASISRWDPDGSSHLAHNDEAHMSVIWDGTKACDWVWNEFTDEELSLVIDQFRRRGQITYEHMHDRGAYGVTRFDSHAGREVVFLALLAMVFHEHIPEAQQWLEWLRPVLCGIWPVWAGDDGAWAQGVSYGLAYVGINTMFATALKRGTGIDLYRRPFWANHGRWRQWCFPPYVEWMGFGDHSERWKSTWERNADLVDIIRRETNAPDLGRYVTEFRAEAQKCDTRRIPTIPTLDAQLHLAEPPAQQDAGEAAGGVLRVFSDGGWAAVRTHLHDAASDVALIFRSSPYGAISHSHANNNDFIMHVAGKVMAMPSGYYSGYGSAHHVHWVWHTKSHNCVTLSDASQLMQSHDSLGAIVNAYEDDRVAYMVGKADASYSLQASRCRRHVMFVKPHNCFFMVDEFVAAPGVASALQWNIHSWNQFVVDEQRRSFLLERQGSALEGHFLFHNNAFFSLSEGWDPPPAALKSAEQWHQQYHLRFTPLGMPEQRNLGVVLCPGHATLEPAEVVSERAGGAEVARIEDDVLLVNDGDTMEYAGLSSAAIAAAVIGGVAYQFGDDGLQH